MTQQSIEEERQEPAAEPPRRLPGSPTPERLIRAVIATAAASGLAGAVCVSVAFTLGEWRTGLTGATLIIISAMAGAVLICDRLMADRQEFYRRGQLDGWMRGWRGQEPTVDDPLWKRSA
jgi:hypothetical protein